MIRSLSTTVWEKKLSAILKDSRVIIFSETIASKDQRKMWNCISSIAGVGVNSVDKKLSRISPEEFNSYFILIKIFHNVLKNEKF